MTERGRQVSLLKLPKLITRRSLSTESDSPSARPEDTEH